MMPMIAREAPGVSSRCEVFAARGGASSRLVAERDHPSCSDIFEPISTRTLRTEYRYEELRLR